MKIYRKNYGFNNFNKKKMLAIFSIYIFFFAIFLSVGFSSFQDTLYFKNIEARVNFDEDIRISNFKVEVANNDAIPSNTDYNYNRIAGDIVLPYSNSSVAYEVSVVNLGNQKAGIADITGLDENLKYTLTDYVLGEPLNEEGQYKLGITHIFFITIEYADGATPVDTPQSFNLEFDFRPFYTITYHGVPGDEAFQTEIMEGLDLVIETELTSVERLKITMDTIFIVKDEHYFYDEASNILKIPNVTGDLLLSYRDVTYLADLSSNTAYFKEATYKTSIKRIDFVNYVDVTGAEKTYDLSEPGSDANSVVGWLIKNDDGTYNLYIGSVYDIYAKNFSNVFSYMTGLREINFQNLNTSEAKSFSYAFYQTKIEKLNLETFNTANAETMINMFAGMTELTTLDVSNFKTENVTSMASMFSGLSKVTELDISTFDTSQVKSMSYMFANMSSLTKIKLGKGFTTENVTSMNNMFAGLKKLQSLDVTGIKTNKLTNSSYMFSNCSTLTYLNLENFEGSSVEDMSYMFYGMSNLETLIIDKFNTSSVTTMEGMFGACSKLKSLDLSTFNTQNVTTMTSMFEGMTALQSLDLSSFVTTSLTTMNYVFRDCTNIAYVDLRNADFPNIIKNARNMFENAYSNIQIIVKDTTSQEFMTEKLSGKGTAVLVTDLTEE